MARTLRVLLTAVASVLLVFGGAIFSPSARALAPSTYITKTLEAAQGVQRDYDVPASVAMAQSILESGWGDSSLSRDYNNYFGIKCTTTPSPHQAGCVSMRTMEYYSSGATYIVDGFRTYDTALDSFRDYGRLLSSLSRYANAFTYTDNPDQFIREVAQGGYATDPTYADKVIRIMRQYDLYQYNALPVQTLPVAVTTTPPATPTPTPSVVGSVTPTPTPTPSVEASVTPTPTPTPTPSVEASVTPTPTPTPTPSVEASVTPTPTPTPSVEASVTPTPTASSEATLPPPAGDVDPSSPADISRVVWVIDPDASTIFFTGPVVDGEGAPYANTAFKVISTDGSDLGTVTTDAQGWLGDSLALPDSWDSTTNFEVTIVIPGGAGTQYTEGSTTIDSPADPEPSQSGTLTEADPEVASSTDTGLDRDRDPEQPLAPVHSAAASPSSSPSPQVSASAPVPVDAVLREDGEAVVLTVADRPEVSADRHPVGEVAHDDNPVDPALIVPAEQVAEEPAGPRSARGTAALVDRSADYVTARLPETGGPAVVVGAIGLVVTAGGATLIGTSLAGRGRRNG